MVMQERDLTGGTTFATLAEVGELPSGKKGRLIAVNVKTSGNGPRVDVREVITAAAYKDSDGRIHARKGSGSRSKAFEPYIGPTKCGFWLEPGMALELADVIARAAVAAMELDPDTRDGEVPA